VTSKPDFKVIVLLLVFMQLTRDLFAIAKFLSKYVLSVSFSNDTELRTVSLRLPGFLYSELIVKTTVLLLAVYVWTSVSAAAVHL